MSDQLYRCDACHAVCAPADMLPDSDLPTKAKSCPGCGVTGRWSKVEVTLVQDTPTLPSGVFAQLTQEARLSGYTEPDTSFRPEGQPLPPAVFAPSWDEFHRDCKTLADKLVDVPITTILVVLRGGAVPGAILAEALGVRDVRSVRAESYGDKRRMELWWPSVESLTRLANSPNRGAGVLVLDDLVDTGATMRYVAEELPQAVLAAVYGKPQGMSVVHAVARPVAQKTWVKFPWEVA